MFWGQGQFCVAKYLAYGDDILVPMWLCQQILQEIPKLKKKGMKERAPEYLSFVKMIFLDWSEISGDPLLRLCLAMF
jgi:hypothetical protein